MPTFDELLSKYSSSKQNHTNNTGILGTPKPDDMSTSRLTESEDNIIGVVSTLQGMLGQEMAKDHVSKNRVK